MSTLAAVPNGHDRVVQRMRARAPAPCLRRAARRCCALCGAFALEISAANGAGS